MVRYGGLSVAAASKCSACALLLVLGGMKSLTAPLVIVVELFFPLQE